MQVVFVGNGTMTIDYHELVDNADLVIRSQKCENYRGFAGTKTDILCVRPCDVPFGRMLAAHRMIPVQPAPPAPSWMKPHISIPDMPVPALQR